MKEGLLDIIGDYYNDSVNEIKNECVKIDIIRAFKTMGAALVTAFCGVIMFVGVIGLEIFRVIVVMFEWLANEFAEKKEIE